MHFDREFQTATLLQNGEVLVVGGFNGCDDDFCTDLRSAELYDPVTGQWLHAASMKDAREQQIPTVLPDGDVLHSRSSHACVESPLTPERAR